MLCFKIHPQTDVTSLWIRLTFHPSSCLPTLPLAAAAASHHWTCWTWLRSLDVPQVGCCHCYCQVSHWTRGRRGRNRQARRMCHVTIDTVGCNASMWLFQQWPMLNVTCPNIEFTCVHNFYPGWNSKGYKNWHIQFMLVPGVIWNSIILLYSKFLILPIIIDNYPQLSLFNYCALPLNKSHMVTSCGLFPAITTACMSPKFCF